MCLYIIKKLGKKEKKRWHCDKISVHVKNLVEEKKEKIISSTLSFKTPTPFDAAKCKLVDKTIRGEYGDLFPHENKPIARVKIPICQFFSCQDGLCIVLF
jgi:hypothetical protein